jgi:RHS repeat-associated protein
LDGIRIVPGQYYDQETNNYYNYFRDYDPATGRYIQSDPIGLDGGLNTYTYVSNNPVIYIDQNGLCRCIATHDKAKVDKVARYGPVKKNTVTCSYKCEDDDGHIDEPIIATHTEWHQNIFDDSGKEGTCHGHQFSPFFNPMTAQTTYTPTDFAWFDPRSGDERGYNSPD